MYPERGAASCLNRLHLAGICRTYVTVTIRHESMYSQSLSVHATQHSVLSKANKVARVMEDFPFQA